MEHRGTYWRKIRLCDLRYYILIGFIFSFLRSLGTSTGPVVPYWIEALMVLALGIPIFGLLGALSAIPVGYYQLRNFYDSGERAPDPDRAPDLPPRARFLRY
jgi:hypothetical protein